jgi:hypothetical protein
MAKACSDAIDPKRTFDLHRTIVLGAVIEPVCRHIRLRAAFIQVGFDNEGVADHVRDPLRSRPLMHGREQGVVTDHPLALTMPAQVIACHCEHAVMVEAIKATVKVVLCLRQQRERGDTF